MSIQAKKMISCRNLDQVCKLKSSMTRLTNRVQELRNELQQLLDDDDNMADLYLSRKLVGSSSPVSGSGAPNWFLNSLTIGSKISRASRASATTQGENDIEDHEMLLEAYFMQIDGTLNKLTMLARALPMFRDSVFVGVFPSGGRVNGPWLHVKWNSSSAEASQPASNNEADNGAESWDGKSDLWQPLNCLVEVANRTKSFKPTSQVSDAKLESTHDPDNEPHVQSTGPKRLRRIRRKKASNFGYLGISSQAVLDAASAKHERRAGPVWFSLVASEDQEGDAPLPQIPANYLRIKDGNLPVSFIQKYLMKKFDLASEAEVEIRCMGQPVVPTLLLYNLVDLWIQTASTLERVPASIGSSAKDFVMALMYARKVPHPE
ncbi:hypothetical protein GH714_036697 [Hevea brasiliensis]|uniref:Uncharacterized protein n=1 Tax=Hevea brasiliensis TaxID=3981 RepID=A0A6A6MSC4_HEVBR|nr:hypothetical protein GH714_036697 [Hevea brasiliensis]